MGIWLCKYLNRFSVMPYFPSAIDVSKWLLLSSGFDFQSKWFIKKVWGRGWGVTLLDSIGVTSDRKQKLESEHQASVCPALPLAPSRRQQWAGGADRRLPLSDSNLWSISIIGGVCRDSYSNNYLDQTVSKATTPPPTTQRTNSECLSPCSAGHWKGSIDS